MRIAEIFALGGDCDYGKYHHHKGHYKGYHHGGYHKYHYGYSHYKYHGYHGKYHYHGGLLGILG